MWETRSKESIKDSIFAQLRELGADYAEAGYEGGNDEGGVNDVAIYRHLDEKERVEVALPEGFGWESALHRDLDDLLSLDFGTWAGDFSASGTVYADLREQRIWREGVISSYEEDPEAGEY